MSHKICILGSAPSSDKLAPFADQSWEIWACSPGNFKMPRIDAWFELHNMDRKWVPGNEPYIDALTRHDRVYIAKPDPRLPHGIVYPLKEVKEFFGNRRFLDTFLQSQVSFMLAFAIMQKPSVIGMWGVDMAAEEEYWSQRPGCHYFFDQAEQREIEVIAPPQSDILEPLPIYGYKEFDPSYWRQKARKVELMDSISRNEEAITKMQAENLIKTGALQDIRYTMNTWRMRHEG